MKLCSNPTNFFLNIYSILNRHLKIYTNNNQLIDQIIYFEFDGKCRILRIAVESYNTRVVLAELCQSRSVGKSSGNLT